MIGEPVTIYFRREAGRDAGNNIIYIDETLNVSNVLVAPGSTDDVTSSTRPNGVKVAWTLHFPKSFNLSLRGAKISVRGETPRPVIGDPHPYTMANTPTSWHMKVELEDVDG